jgi:hypothetical protein
MRLGPIGEPICPLTHRLPITNCETKSQCVYLSAFALAVDRRLTEDGTKLAHRILELYTKVMGGLQASHPPPIAGAQGEEMTKTPHEFEPTKPITKAEREARKAFRQLDAEKALTDHEIAQKAFSANRERLKAERLAREAAGTPVAAATKAKTKKAR